MPEQQHSLRDLSWALHSEPLIDNSHGPEWPPGEWFRDLDLQDPAPPEGTVSTRLGLRFEQLIHDWLEVSSAFTCLENNLPVRTAERTIGEFDLIVNSADVIEHWELAVKFYLGTGDQRDLDCWFGPNPTDTLGTKLRRLEQHQMQLSAHPASVDLLRAMQIEVERVRGFVKGRLFYPLPLFLTETFVYPEAINPNHHRGWWATLADFCQHDRFSAAAFCHLPKADWLAELVACPQKRRKSKTETLKEFEASGRETWHVAVLNESGTEVSRGFIVTPDWLAQTS